jgi:AraC-like DNA-binding protein
MKAVEICLTKESDQSFIFYHEKNPFSRWHYHPEFELVFIKKGAGKRMIGDHIDTFEENDLVFLGSNLPHEWLCNEDYYTKNGEFKGEGIVIQFQEKFLGEIFFSMPENKKLLKVINQSAQGCLISGPAKQAIIQIMNEMITMEVDDRLYALFNIFGLLSKNNDFEILASPSFTASFKADKNLPMKRAIQYIVQHFHEKIHIKSVLDIANMSNTAFSVMFKKTYNMTFSEYVLKVRIGYACSLLTDNNKSISQVSFEAGFENLSNFNRLFKKIKNSTPKEFRKKAFENEKYDKFYN